MPAGIGLPEILIVLVIVLVVFGPKRLPQLGRSLGGGMREFKDSISGKSEDEDEERRELTAAPAPSVPAPAPAPAPEPVATAPAEPADAPARRDEPSA